MARIRKAIVTIGRVPVAAIGTIVWKLQSGIAPYMATFTVSNKVWKAKLKHKKGSPVELMIIDSYGTMTKIEDLTIMYEAPSRSPNTTSFVVADRRWKWDRSLIVRDYNLSKRTGDINFDEKTLPIENKVPIPKYDYRPFSLKDGTEVWGAKDILEDILEQLEGPENGGNGSKRYKIDSVAPSGEFSVQNVSLSDPGSLALQRILAFIPGTEVYINMKGDAVVFNAVDMKGGEKYLKKLPPSTWEGDKHEFIDYGKIRPGGVNVYYEREVEIVCEYNDDFATGTQISLLKDDLWCENVIPTVYPKTEIEYYDPEEDTTIKVEVPPGTWVPVKDWLKAHDKIKPDGALPWTFKTLRIFWLNANLEGLLIGTNLRGVGIPDKTNVLQAIRVLKEHFRQTFRISRRYMERFRDVKPFRVAMLDPITGARQQATVWGQMTVAPTNKGTMICTRDNKERAGTYYLIDSMPALLTEPEIKTANLVETDPGPQKMVFLDREIGIFRLESSESSYGTYGTSIPGFLTGADGRTPNIPIRDLGQQDNQGVSLGAGMRLGNGTNEFVLPYKYKFRVMFTMIPGSPNNKARMHKEVVTLDEIKKFYEGKVPIKKGFGPILEVFVPASEATARLAWKDDKLAEKSIAELIGLNEEDPTKGGIEDDPDTPDFNEANRPQGFIIVNTQRELWSHSRAVAAEIMSVFIDGTQGRIATRVPKDGIELKGNMRGTSIQVEGSPSSKTLAIHEFRGRSNPISRLALFPESARKIVLGIVRFAKD